MLQKVTRLLTMIALTAASLFFSPAWADLNTTPMPVSVSAFAQNASSPEGLANAVQSLINSKNIDRVRDFVHSVADSESLESLKASLASYIGAENLEVYVVAKDDNEAVRRFQADTSVAGRITIKQLDERVKFLAEKGWYFTLDPLGDLVVFGKKPGVPSAGSRLSMVYGKYGDSYFITLARKK